MKAIAFAVSVALTAGGCGTMQTIAPNTAAGFTENGVIGALGGASGAVVAGCRSLDAMQIAVDDLAVATGTGGGVDDLRAARMRACAVAQAVQAVGLAADSAFDGQVTVHRR